MFRLHVTNRNGFLQKTFNLTKDDPDPAPELLPLAESLTLAHLATSDGHYSRIRLWGSIGFIVASLLLGYLIDLQGINILLWVLLIAQAIIFFISPQLEKS